MRQNVAKLRPISLMCGRFRAFDIAISLICGTYRAICRVRALEFQRSYFAYPGFGATDKRDSKTEGGKSATHRRDTRKNTQYDSIGNAEPAPPQHTAARYRFDTVSWFVSLRGHHRCKNNGKPCKTTNADYARSRTHIMRTVGEFLFPSIRSMLILPNHRHLPMYLLTGWNHRSCCVVPPLYFPLFLAHHF